MAGRGRLGEVPPIENDRLFMLRNGRWQPLREGDSDNEETARTYMPRFLERLSALGKECDLEGVPVVLGELSSFLADDPQGRCAYFGLVNQALAKIAETVPHIALADSAGLGSNGDYLHFNAESLREFGRRYFRKYLELID
jgi:hypothetical protein